MNPKRKSKLREYTSEFILDGGNQFAFTFPFFIIPIVFAFDGEWVFMIAYTIIFTVLYLVFFLVYLNKNSGQNTADYQQPTSWAFRNTPEHKLRSPYPVFLKNYGFGSTTVFLTVGTFWLAGPYIQSLITQEWHHSSHVLFGIILIDGWDLGIYLFSILAGMERQFNAWKRENITRNMTSAQYADFQRDEYLAERGRAAGFNEGYMVGRNSKH